MTVHLSPNLHAFWSLEKTVLCENCVCGIVLMFQLPQNTPLVLGYTMGTKLPETLDQLIFRKFY